ncbi:MAG: cysteine--tRNA ligase [Methanomassiliicoccales archaeon]|nr:MAG: cysteine--tRNA ligase [Methanomassiliicoccales archaeon]
MAIQVYNTLTRKMEEFEPLHGNRVNMFVCGVTPYDYTHLGHAKTYIAFDTIAKYLRYRGYSVFYIQNVTDVDDHLINRSKETGESEAELAEKFFKLFIEDMTALGMDSVNLYAYATEHVPEIVEQIEGLIKKGYAYESNGSVYFEVGKFSEFGKLSKQVLEKLRPGARVEVDENKRNPEDFALWKAEKPGEPTWDSPWGKGRPGWHIEDTAIAMAYFGEQYDIHGGATELIFPHHESEVAQAEALTGKKPFVKYWLHTGVLNVKGEKMSKSLNNFWRVQEALEEYEPDVLRFFLVNAHYRSPVDYTDEVLEEAKQGYERLVETVQNVRFALKMQAKDERTSEDDEVDKAVKEVMQKFEESMDNDFNTREAISHLFTFSTKVNAALSKGLTRESLEGVLKAYRTIGDVLGLFKKGIEKEDVVDGLMEFLVEMREKAREEKNFEVSDEIRDRLAKIGILLEDTKDGPRWKKR